MSDKKRSHKKMTGIDIYICIDNTDLKGILSIGRPYKVIFIKRDHLFNLYYLIKNNKGIKHWYPIWRFKPRNEQDDRVRGKNEK